MDGTLNLRIDDKTLRQLDAMLEAKQNEDRRRGGAIRTRSHVVRALIRQAYILAAAKGEVDSSETDES